MDATNETDEALTKLRRAVELAPADPVPHVALVQTLAARGRDREAAALIKQVAARVEPGAAPSPWPSATRP